MDPREDHGEYEDDYADMDSDGECNCSDMKVNLYMNIQITYEIQGEGVLTAISSLEENYEV